MSPAARKRGSDYDGLTQMVLQLDTQRAFGWYGGMFNVSALQIHGRNLSADNLLTLQTASGIEADRATRLWELWYQQKFLDEDRLDIKIGQQSLDQEFMVSQNALLFVNTMFGWPMLPSADLPGGGPAYPLSALGVRLRARPIDSLTVPGRRVQRQPGANNDRRSADAQPVRHQLPAERRRAGDRRSAVRLSLARHDGLRRPGGAARAHLQAGLLVRHRKLRRPAVRQHRPVARQSREQRHAAAAITAISASTPSPTRWSGSIRTRADRTINVFARAWARRRPTAT